MQKQRNKCFELAQKRYKWSENKFNDTWEDLINIRAFPANGNVFESGQEFTEDMLKLMRLKVEYHLANALDDMAIMLDENVVETPKRLAKVFCGDSLSCDTELGGGRFSKPVRLPTFPNIRDDKHWITKKVRLISTCSHHFIPFTGEATISYRPGGFVLGISKLQRLTNYVANRFWLQEDLTAELHEAVRSAAQVDACDVKVTIVAKHGCEMHRGVKNQDCDFTTEE